MSSTSPMITTPASLRSDLWMLCSGIAGCLRSESLADFAGILTYLLKEQFQQLWTYISPAWAGKYLDAWCRQTMRSRIEPMKKIARMLRSHRELILNYFKARGLISNGIVEGFNNKAKLTMRKSYGFRSYRITELALYHSLGNLPEPELTHEFY